MAQRTVVRLLIYTGPEEWIDATLAHGAVPPNGKTSLVPPNSGQMIESAILVNSTSDTLPSPAELIHLYDKAVSLKQHVL